MDKNEIVILLVDDDEDCRLLIRDAIEAGNIDNTIYEVSSGEEALDFIYKRGQHENAPTPGLVYLDIEMGGISGGEVLKQIKSDEKKKHIPIVMMTSLNDDREKMTCAQHGANSYTVKPTDPEVFIKTVIEASKYWITIHKSPKSNYEQ